MEMQGSLSQNQSLDFEKLCTVRILEQHFIAMITQAVDIPSERLQQSKTQVLHVENVIKKERREFPKFEDLPLGNNDPPFSAWGLWGEDDEAGTIVREEPRAL